MAGTPSTGREPAARVTGRVRFGRLQQSQLSSVGKLVAGQRVRVKVVDNLGEAVRRQLTSTGNITWQLTTARGRIAASVGALRSEGRLIRYGTADLHATERPEQLFDQALRAAKGRLTLFVIRAGTPGLLNRSAIRRRIQALTRAGVFVVVENAGDRAEAPSARRSTVQRSTGRGFDVGYAGGAAMSRRPGNMRQWRIRLPGPGWSRGAARGDSAARGDYEPPRPTPRAQLDEPPTRHVNPIVVLPDTEAAVPARPLAKGTRYDLLVNIGPYHPASLLGEPDGVWPQEQLPAGDLWLRVALHMQGWAEPLVASISLPPGEASFACDCPPDGEHDDSCQPRRWARLPLTTPNRRCRWEGELVVYYRAVPVHAHRLTLPVGEGLAGGPRARVTYRLTRLFTDLRPLADRTVSVYRAPRGSRLIVNGAGFVDNPFAIEANAADSAVRDVRRILYRAHLRVKEGKEVPTFLDGYRKSRVDFEADLRRLAAAGAAVYEGLFRHDLTYHALPKQIRLEARARGRPAILSVAAPTEPVAEDRHVPWSLVYDLPLGLQTERYRCCESVAMFGPGGTNDDVPPHCPVSDHLDDKDDMLCPFGFWGLSCMLEVPPHTDTGLRRVVSDDPSAVATVVATDRDLDETLTREHLADLGRRLAATVLAPDINTEADLARALADEVCDVAYLYCHCGYYALTAGGTLSLYLNYGGTRIGTTTIGKWARKPSYWPRPHWPQRKPLVVLNGCHTVESTSGTLSNFVDSFVNRAGASGVVGTEVALDQGLASFAMGIFLERLCAGESVGEALRRTRWDLLRRGNVMGLAYTPYCFTELTLRPPTNSEEPAA